MTEKLRSLFEFKISIGNLLTIVVLLIAGYAGYVELRTNHSNLDRDFREHESYDDVRFREFTTKDSREMRDRWVDDRLKEILERVKNIEAMHRTK